MQDKPITFAIAGIRTELHRMQTVLRETRRENETLKEKLALRPDPLPGEIDLDALRRGIVFCCHPDRGGNTGLLRQVLELFDFLSPDNKENAA